MRTTWIEAAMSGGGVMTVCKVKHKDIYEAAISWEGLKGRDVMTGGGYSVLDAIETLGEKLQDDAVKEMQESGAV